MSYSREELTDLMVFCSIGFLPSGNKRITKILPIFNLKKLNLYFPRLMI